MSYPVYVSALLANVPSGIVFAFTAFDLKESCVFVLVPQTTFEASENCLGIEPSALRCHTGNSAKIIKLVILSGLELHIFCVFYFLHNAKNFRPFFAQKAKNCKKWFLAQFKHFLMFLSFTP